MTTEVASEPVFEPPHTTLMGAVLLPQTTLKPLDVLVPQATDWPPQTTDWPPQTTDVPQTTEVPQTTDVPQTTEVPLTRTTWPVEEL